MRNRRQLNMPPTPDQRVGDCRNVVEIDDYEGADMREAAKDNPKYDVAISFLAKDQQVVEPIAEALGECLKVFFFPRAQEALAGTGGLESMRTPLYPAHV